MLQQLCWILGDAEASTACRGVSGAGAFASEKAEFSSERAPASTPPWQAQRLAMRLASYRSQLACLTASAVAS